MQKKNDIAIDRYLTKTRWCKGNNKKTKLKKQGSTVTISKN